MIDQIFVALAVIAAVFMFVAWRERRSATTSVGFFQAGRNIGAIPVSGTYIATSLALANAVFYFLWLGYTAGLVGIWIQVAWCFGFLVLFQFAPKILMRSGHLTFHDFIASHFGRNVAILAAIISFVGLSLNFGYEVLIGSTIATEAGALGILPVLIVAALVTLLVISYCVVGGFAAVIRTDMWQWSLATISLLICFFVLITGVVSDVGWREFVASNPDHFDFFSLQGIAAIGGGLALLSNLLFSLPWQICDMTSWQKLSASDDRQPEAVRVGILASGVFLLIVPGFLVLLLGILLRSIEGADTALLGAMVQQVAALGGVVTVLVLIGLFAAQVSSADTFLIGASQALVVDLIARNRDNVPMAAYDAPDEVAISIPDTHVNTAKRLIPIIAITSVSIVFALWYFVLGSNTDGLFNVVYIVYSMQLALAVVAILALLARNPISKPAVGWLSIGFGVAANFTVLVGSSFGLELLIAEQNVLSVNAMPTVCLLASLLGAIIGFAGPTKRSVSPA